MKSFVRGVTILSACFVTALANGTTIWAVDNLGSFNAGTNGDRVITFDSANPQTSPVSLGATNVPSVLMSGLDFDAAGNLYAYGFNGSTLVNTGLYSINQTTGNATLIGSGGVTNGQLINDLSFNPVDGKMYAVSSKTSGGGGGQVFTINLATGAATLVGTITGATGALFVGMATDANGQQYLHDIVNDRMYKLNGAAASQMSSTEGFDANFSQGMTIDWAGDGTWYHGAFNNSQFLTQLWTVSTSTGAGTLVGNIGGINSGTGLPEYETGDIAIAAAAPPACPGDFNNDGIIDLSDLSAMLAEYGCTSGCATDLDADGDVDLGDLAAELAIYGTTCP